MKVINKLAKDAKEDLATFMDVHLEWLKSNVDIIMSLQITIATVLFKSAFMETNLATIYLKMLQNDLYDFIHIFALQMLCAVKITNNFDFALGIANNILIPSSDEVNACSSLLQNFFMSVDKTKINIKVLLFARWELVKAVKIDMTTAEDSGHDDNTAKTKDNMTDANGKKKNKI